MSEISRDLQDQMNAGLAPTLKRFLEAKPGYDGPTLSDAEQERIKAQEAAQARAEAILAHVRELGDDY